MFPTVLLYNCFCLQLLLPKLEYRQVSVQLPFRGSPKKDDYIKFNDFFRSDHSSFWFANLSALQLTDSANFRGFMRDCYHQPCDNMNHVTPQMIKFLSKTVDTVTAMAEDLTTNKGKKRGGVGRGGVGWGSERWAF